MERKVQSWVAGIFLLVSSVVLAQEVKTNYMPGTNFSKYHTYKWVTIGQGEQPNQIVDGEIKQAVDSQLAAKGLTKTDADQADIYVGYQTALNQQKEWTAYGMGGGWGLVGGWRRQRVRPSTWEHLCSTCMTLPRSSLCGLGERQKRLTRAGARKKTRKSWIRDGEIVEGLSAEAIGKLLLVLDDVTTFTGTSPHCYRCR